MENKRKVLCKTCQTWVEPGQAVAWTIGGRWWRHTGRAFLCGVCYREAADIERQVYGAELALDLLRDWAAEHIDPADERLATDPGGRPMLRPVLALVHQELSTAVWGSGRVIWPVAFALADGLPRLSMTEPTIEAGRFVRVMWMRARDIRARLGGVGKFGWADVIGPLYVGFRNTGGTNGK